MSDDPTPTGDQDDSAGEDAEQEGDPTDTGGDSDGSVEDALEKAADELAEESNMPRTDSSRADAAPDATDDGIEDDEREAEAATDSDAVVEPGVESGPDSTPEPDGETISEADAEPDGEPEQKAVGGSDADAKPEAEPDADDEPEPDAETESTAEPDADDEPEPDAEPESAAEPDPDGETEQDDAAGTTDTEATDIDGGPDADVPQDVQEYARFTKMDAAHYERVNEFLRNRTYITAREWAIARLCADFRTDTGVEMTKIGENLPRLIPFMTDTYSPQAVNQARASFEEKVTKAGATFLYGAMSGFFTAEELDETMYEVTEVAKFLLEVEGVDLSVEEELETEDEVSRVMREVRQASAEVRGEEVKCPECGHVHETE
jgi:hypothetical protein